MIKSIIFDFDGVILDSVDIKSEVFKEVFAPFGKKILDYSFNYHIKNGGISRYEKIKHILNYFFNPSEAQVLEKSIIDQFNFLIKKKIFQANFIKGALEFIENNHDSFNMFISTGTPEKEIIDILKFKKIYHFFTAVYGSPDIKENHVEKILKNNNEKIEEYVFLGDSETDLITASKYKIKFIGVENEHFDFKRVLKIKDLSNLEFVLKNY